MAEVEGNIEVNVATKEPETKSDTVQEKAAEVNGHSKTNGEPENVEDTKNTEGNGKVVKDEGETTASSPEGEEINAPADVEGGAITEEATKEEEKPPKVIVHQLPPGRHVPSISPFCLKLETYLRLNTIPYENQYSYKVGKKGKVPWIEYKGERITDSSQIIKYLNDTFEIECEKDISPEQLALGRAVKTMIEENTYWAGVYSNFIENFNDFKKIVAPDTGAGIGFSVSMKMSQRKARAQLDGHGLGRHSRDEIYAIAQEDIKAVSTLLGDKDFILGDKPSSVDCTLFGFFANVIWGGVESPLTTYVKENAQNISQHCVRMKELCWLDWDDMVLGQRPEPNLKKGFSFRKNKKKVAKPQKEAPTEDESAKDDEKEAETTNENEDQKPAEQEEDKPTEEEQKPTIKEDKPSEDAEKPKEEETPVVAEQKSEEPAASEPAPAEPEPEEKTESQ